MGAKFGLASLMVLLVIAGLILGAALTYGLFPKVITKEVPKIEYKDKLVEVEVVKEVPMDLSSVRDDAVAELMRKVRKTDSLQVCNGDEYDIGQISLRDAGDYSFSISVDEDEKVVGTTAKLKYKQEDVKQCFRNIDFEVKYEEDEKPVVKIL